MRFYNCYVGLKINNQIQNNGNTACFAGIQTMFFYTFNEKTTEEKTIYIYNFRHKETEQYISLLIKEINKITPCELVIINNKEYIKFEVFNTYDQTLVVLNFIRNLWYSPTEYNFKAPKLYSVYFFEELAASKYRDAMKKLTTANKTACKMIQFKSFPGHSNCGKTENFKIKTIKELKEYQGTNTRGFLTT